MKIHGILFSCFLCTGGLSSLKHFKSEVDSIAKDRECGISLEDGEIEFRVGDVIVCYESKQVKQEIDWNPGF
jgi:translation initiation factor IF-2